MPAQVPQPPQFTNPLYEMLNNVLQQRFPDMSFEAVEAPGSRPGQPVRFQVTPKRAMRSNSAQVPGSPRGTYSDAPLTFQAQYGPPSPLGKEEDFSNRSVIITTPSRQKYILGAAGIGTWNYGTQSPEYNFMNPTENLANIVGGAIDMAGKPYAGTPNQLFEWGLTNQSPSRGMVGGALRLSPNQMGTQAPGLWAQRITMAMNYERGVAGSFDIGQRIQKQMLANITSGREGTPWRALQNYSVIDRLGDTFRLKPAGDVEMFAQPGQPALLSMGRAEGRFGIKTSSSMGTRNALTPLELARDQETQQTFFRPLTSQAITEGNSWRNLPQYARLNALFGGEAGEGGDFMNPAQPQQRLTSLSMFAPTTFPGAAIMNQSSYSGIFGFGYEKTFRIGLGSMNLQDLLNPDKGLELSGMLRPGGMIRAGRRQNQTIGYFGTRENAQGETERTPIRLGLRTSDFIVGNEPGAVSLMIPATYGRDDYGPYGEPTTDLYGRLQQRFPGVNIVPSADITEPYLNIHGNYLTGASGKGETELKFGFKRGVIGEMETGGVKYTPTLVTGETKSLPATLMGAFALQPYEQQMEMLAMVDPRLAAETRKAYKYSGTGPSPALPIRDIAAQLTALRAPANNPDAVAGVNYPITTPLNMFTEMLGKFLGANNKQNAANIERYGIGRTGEQWLTSQVSDETRMLYQGIISQQLKEIYPKATEEQRTALGEQSFTFKKQTGGMYEMRQRTSGVVMPTILPVSEEWLGRYSGNFEAMASTQQQFPEFAQALGMAPEQGPLQPGVSRATRSWAEAYKLEAYRQDAIYGNVVQPPGSVSIAQKEAKTILDVVKGKISKDTPAEEAIETLKGAIEKVVPEAAGAGSLWFPGVQQAILAPSAFRGITSIQRGKDVTQMSGVYAKAVQQLMKAEWQGNPGDTEGGAYSAYQTSINRTLSGRRARSAIRRIYGRENQLAFSARYEPMPELGAQELFAPNEILQKMGLNVKELNNIKGPIPMVVGRQPILSRGGGVVGMSLVTEAELERRGIAYPKTPSVGGKAGDPFSWGTVFTGEAFSRSMHGDWDRDLLFAMLGLEPGTREETYTTKGGEERTRTVKTWNTIMTPDIVANLNMPMQERLKQYENMMNVMGPFSPNLDVLSKAVRSILEDPYKEATKTSRLTKKGAVQAGIPMNLVSEASYLTNVTAASGKGRSYNVRRFMEAALTAEGGRGEEEIAMGYDTSAYMFQQYLDVLRTKEQGFTPLEEAIGTINVGRTGKMTAMQDSGESNFAYMTDKGQYDLGALALNAGLDPSLSNEFLSVMFGQGKAGAKGIRKALKPFGKYTKVEGDKVVPNEDVLEQRGQAMQEMANNWNGKGLIGATSPISNILTVSAIERARRNQRTDRERWEGMQTTYVPWQGKEMQVQDVIKDEQYRATRTAYRLLVRQGQISRSDIDILAERGAGLPLGRLAKGISENVLRTSEAQAIAQASSAVQDQAIAATALTGIENLMQGTVRMHASEVYEAYNRPESMASSSDAITQIAARTAFGKDILTKDAAIFGVGEEIEQAVGLVKDKRFRQGLGIHLGGRTEKSALAYVTDRTVVEGNPDFFAMTRGAPGTQMTPLFTEVKSTNKNMFNAIKARLAGKSTGNQGMDDQADEQLRKYKLQTQGYEEALVQHRNQLNSAQAEFDVNPNPQSEAALKQAKANMVAIAEQLVPTGGGGSGTESLTRSLWRQEISAGRVGDPRSQLVLANYESREALVVSPEQFSPYATPDYASVVQGAQAKIGSASVMQPVMERISNLPTGRPSVGGAHAEVPLSLSSAVPAPELQTARRASEQMATSMALGLPPGLTMLPPISAQQQAAALAASPITPVGGGVSPSFTLPTSGGASAGGGAGGATAGGAGAGSTGGNIPGTPVAPAVTPPGAPGGGRINRASRRAATASLAKAIGQAESLGDIDTAFEGVQTAVNRIMGLAPDTDLTENTFFGAMEKDVHGLIATIGQQPMKKMGEAVKLNAQLERAYNQATAAGVGPRTKVRGQLKKYLGTTQADRLNALEEFGTVLQQFGKASATPEGLNASVFMDVMGGEKVQNVIKELAGIGIDINDPLSVMGGLQPDIAKQAVEIMNKAPHAMGAVRGVAKTIGDTGGLVPPTTANAATNLNWLMGGLKNEGLKVKSPEAETEISSTLKPYADKLRASFDKLTTASENLTKAKGDEVKVTQESFDKAKARYNLDLARYTRVGLQEEYAALKGQPDLSREEIARQTQIGGMLERTAGAERTALEDVREAEGGGGLTPKKLSRFGRAVMGGWGLFYMGHLAKLGMGEWQQGFAAEEQYQASVGQAAGQYLGAYPGQFNVATQMQRAAQIRGGGAMGANLARTQAALPMGLIGDIGGAAMTGVGAGLLTSYVGGAMVGAGLAAEATVGVAIPVIGLIAGTLALGATQISNAMDRMTPVRQATRTLRMGQLAEQGRTFEAIGQGAEWMWNATNQMIAGPQVLQRESRYVSAMEAYTGAGGAYDWRKQAARLEGTPSIGISNMAMATALADTRFEGLAPEYAASAIMMQYSGGVNNKYQVEQAAQLASAMQAGMDINKLPSQVLAATQGGYPLPSRMLGISGGMQTFLTGSGAQTQATIAAGAGVLGQVPMAYNILNASATTPSEVSSMYYSDYPIRPDISPPVRGTSRGKMTKGGAKSTYESDLAAYNAEMDKYNQNITNWLAKTTSIAAGGDDEKRLAITQRWAKIAGQPLEREGVTALTNWSIGAAYGLETAATMPTPEQFLGTWTPEQRVAEDRKQFRAARRNELAQTMVATTTLSAEQITGISAGAAAAGSNALNFLQQVVNRDPQAVAMQAFRTGGYKQRPELISVDLNRQGGATGLPLYTSNMFDFQAQQVWGAGYAQGPGGAFRAGAVQGVQSEYGMLYGSRALQWQQQQRGWEYQQQQQGFQQESINLQKTYMPQFWSIEDRQRQLGYRQQAWDFGRAEQGMAIGARQFGEQQALSQRGLGLSASQFTEGRALQWRGMQMNQAWAQEQWGYQDVTRQMQWGWKQEDFQENVRFTTGRQRRLAERQMGRETIMYGLETEQINKEREHQKDVFRLQEQQFNLERKHFGENQKMQEESMALQRKHFEENQKFQLEGIKQQRAFYEERKAIEEESIKLSREYQQEQMKLSQTQLEAQKKYAADMHQMAIDMTKLGQTQEDIVGKFQEGAKFEKEFIDGILAAETSVTKIHDMWIEIAKSLGLDLSSSGSGGQAASKEASNLRKPKKGRALGGYLSSGEPSEVGEAGREIFVPETSGTIIPMTKLHNPWQDLLGTRNMKLQDSKREPLTLHLHVGGQYLGKFIIDTVEKELNV